MTSRGISVPSLTRDEMVEVDRLMVEKYRIQLIQMMENAGRNLALLVSRLLDGDLTDRPIVVLAGRGNNGGGGLVAARHLLNGGAWVQVLLASPPATFQGVSGQQLAILEAMDLPVAWAEEGWELPPADLIIDAIIGYGLRGRPRGDAAALIQLANSSMAPIVSLDIPSGLDAGDGTVHEPHILAAATMTLALPKVGLLTGGAGRAVGELYLGDIGVPPDLYRHLGYSVPPLFVEQPLLPLQVEAGVAYLLANPRH